MNFWQFCDRNIELVSITVLIGLPACLGIIGVAIYSVVELLR